MIQQLTPVGAATPQHDAAPVGGLQPTTRIAVLVLVVLLLSNGPLFVCMPLTNDTALYDLQARVLREGGVLYRDLLEPNLPGVVWIHAAVRTFLGESSEAMRLFDLAAFAGIVLLLVHGLGITGRSRAVQTWTAAALLLFYFSISEWSHCQRDVWLLLPALGGLHLRVRQNQRCAGQASLSTLIAWALLEGVVWGAGVWLKPMVMLPALAAWLVSAALTRKLRPRLCDLAGLLAGGLLAGAAGVAWLFWTGAWPHFWHTLVEWNPQYFAAGKEHWTALRFLAMTSRFFPWILLHLVAAPLAGYTVYRGVQRAFTRPPDGLSTWPLLFAAFYLAWLVQAFFLQHLFDYVHAPVIVIAIALLAGTQVPHAYVRRWRFAAAIFLGLALLVSPVLKGERLALWMRCWTEGSSPEIRNGLAHAWHPNWEDMHHVTEYLRQQNLKDGELTCYNNDLVYLYNDLGLTPSTRYVYLETLFVFFPDRMSEMRRAVAQSRHKFVVSDMTAVGVPYAIAQRGPNGWKTELPETFPPELRGRFPWSYPIVFRSGNMLVHRVPSKS